MVNPIDDPDIDNLQQMWAAQDCHEADVRALLAEWIRGELEAADTAGGSHVCRGIGMPLARDLLAIVERRPIDMSGFDWIGELEHG